MGWLWSGYRPADLPEMTDLWVETWSDTLPQIDFSARRGWFEALISDLVESGVNVILARRDGRVAGFVTVHPGTGHVEQLAVARAARGSGLASALLDRARMYSPSRLLLSVNADNHRAVRFYEREGFVRTGEGVSAASGLPIYHYLWRDPDA